MGAREGLHFKFPQFCTAWESVWKAGKCRTQWESPPDSPHTGPVSLRHRQEAKPRLKPAPPGQSRSLTSASGGRRLPGCHIGSSRDLAGASRLHPAARHPPPLGVERPSWHVHGRGPADPWPRGSGRGADVVTANAGPSSCVGVASNLGLQCRNNRQAQKTNVVGTHDTGIALMSDAAPCAGDTGRRLRGPCSAGQGPDANAKGSASSRPHPGAHGQQGSAGDKFPPTSRGTSSLTLPWARSYSANSEPLPQAARLYLTWPPPRRSVPASPTLPRARTAIAVHLFVPLERRAPRRQDGVLL